MTTTEILQDSVTYQEIVAEAKLEGELQGTRNHMKRMLTIRFGPLPSWAADRLQSADSKALDRWTAQFPSESTLEGILK